MNNLQQLIDEHQPDYSLAKPFYLDKHISEAKLKHIAFSQDVKLVVKKGKQYK
jgi:hypothetical protein